MSAFQILFAIFLLVPLVEIYLLVQVGGLIGAGWTIFLVVFTAILGAWLVRIQGIATLGRVQATLQRGELPAVEMLEGLLILVAGALLLTPGFFTDGVGFIFLVPGLRRALVVTLLRRGFIRPTDGGPPRSASPGTPAEKHRSSRTLEGKYRRMDD